MKRLILSLVAVAMLGFMAVPAMAAHNYYNGCYDYYPTRRVSHYRTYAPRLYYSSGHYGGHHGYYGGHSYGHYGGHYGGHGLGISTRNFSFFLGH